MFPRTMPRFIAMITLIWLGLVGTCLIAPALAQPASEPVAHRVRLDLIRADFERLEKGLNARDPKEAELARARQQIDPAVQELRTLIDDLTPRAEQAKARLEQLGTKAANESPEIAGDRLAREKSLAEADDAVRIGRALLVQGEQIGTEIGDKRRHLFARALFQRSASLISLDLWQSVARSLPSDLKAVEILINDWISTIWNRFNLANMAMVLIAILAAAGLYAFRTKALAAANAKLEGLTDATRLRRALAAFVQLIAGAAPAALASWLLFTALDASDLIPNRLEPLVGSILFGIAGIVFMKALANALFAPGAPQRRVLGVMDSTAHTVERLAVTTATALAVGKSVEALLQAIAAGLSLTIAARGLIALAFAMTLIIGLNALRDRGQEEEQCLGPYIPVEGAALGPIRVAGWIAAIIIGLASILGYAAFAWFLSEQVLWVAIVIALLVLVYLLIENGIQEGFLKESRVSQTLQANVGLRKRAVEQIGVVFAGISKLLIGIIAILLVLAPWGVESNDLVSSLRAAFFGFKVGDVTVSLSSIIVGITLFCVGIVATRSLQTWLETRLLPSTELDTGLRNSIKTGAGYVGFVGATALAVSSMGLSLDKLAIVAGALSVGIGFGLQSIVNNFVSGLILLWERSIRVGDWIVVGTDQGHVRRISVRSTEIETFDRSLVILPNSNLVSGVVKNRVRNDRSGRIILPVGTRYSSDPDRVRTIIEGCAAAHDGVLETPSPKAYLLKMGDNTLSFELRCFVPDVDQIMRTSSDLHFAIFRALKNEGIEIA
jgi:potassium-dependent mechanosensitive channel